MMGTGVAAPPEDVMMAGPTPAPEGAPADEGVPAEGMESSPASGDIFERIQNLSEEETEELQSVLENSPLVKEIIVGLVERSAELLQQLEGGDPAEEGSYVMPKDAVENIGADKLRQMQTGAQEKAATEAQVPDGFVPRKA
ncbi:hypothetical protein N9937_02000 [bacterium]|nr:hypothetical protein [bacterium]